MIATNKAAVRRALEDWFIAARAGETLGARETAALSASGAAAQSSDYFYERLMHHSADEVALAQAKGDVVLGFTNAEFGFFQAEQLHCMFGGDTDAKVRVNFNPDGKMSATHLTTGEIVQLVDEVEKPAPEDFFG